MICPNCKKEVNTNYAFCIHCGTKLSNISSELSKDFKEVMNKAEEGDAQAQAEVGRAFYRGEEGVEEDCNKARGWFEKAVQQGNALGFWGIGVLYDDGEGGLPVDCNKAFEYAKKSADQNCPDGQNLLGYMYDKGRGTEQNPVEACRWYRLAADQGNARAQNNLGIMYANGTGVDKNLTVALELYTKASEKYTIYRYNKAKTLEILGRYDEAFRERQRYYQEIEPGVSGMNEPEWENFINGHLKNSLMLELKNKNSSLVDFTACLFMLNEGQTLNIYDGSSIRSTHGTYGSGYIALTDREIVIVGSSFLSKKFSFIGNKTARNLVGLFVGYADYRKPIKYDSIINISYNLIKNVYIGKDGSLVVEANGEIQIYFGNEENNSFGSAIQAGRRGLFMEPFEKKNEKTEKEGVSKLKQLKELLDNGVLSSQEYEEKRQKVLSEMGL